MRKKLRKMDESITDGIKKAIADGARDIERDMVGGAPVDEGDLVRSIATKIGSDGFTAVIGPGADNAHITKNGFQDVKTGIVDGKLVGITKSGADTKATVRNKHAVAQIYKALWIEFGTKAGKPGSHATPARPFIQPAYDVNKDSITANVKTAVAKALQEASGA